MLWRNPKNRHISNRLAKFLYCLFIMALLSGCSSIAGTGDIQEPGLPAENNTGRENPPESEIGDRSNDGDISEPQAANENIGKVRITVDNTEFTAVFYDNETARALLDLMPVSFDMADLNRNEKFIYLPENLPGGSGEKPETIYAGEIMCWSGNCLVLFYETFSNSYGGYRSIGYIEDVPGLAQALGTGNVTVTFTKSTEQ